MVYIAWSLEEIYQLAKGWQEKEFDGIIVFDGNRGIGKSTGAYKFCNKFDCFKPKKDICFSREDVMKGLSEKRKGIIFADEMINVGYNREFYEGDQKMFIKMINMYRDHCNILVCCVPNFYDLDNQFRNLVKMRVNVISRGVAVIHTKNHSSYSKDKWDSDVNEKIEKTWLKKNVFKPKYDKLTTYRGFLTYSKLSPKQEELYKSIKEEKRTRLMEDSNFKKPKSIWDDLFEKYKAGKVDRDSLLVWCNIQDIKINNALSNLQLRAKNEGTTLKQIEDHNKLTKVANAPTPIKKENGEVRLRVV